jgi:tRNA modification GTPase
LSDLIESTTSKEVFLSGSSLFGDLSEKLMGFSNRINDARVRVEGEIDFSDEGEVFMDESLISDLGLLVEDFNSFVSMCANKRDLSSKKNVFLVGPTNSGKSSVFNRLVGYERAIVTDRPGTTRDMISSEAFFETSVFSVFDTAGVRETDDVIEEKGIEMSLSQLGDADVVIGVFEEYDEEIVDEFKKRCSDGSLFLNSSTISSSYSSKTPITTSASPSWLKDISIPFSSITSSVSRTPAVSKTEKTLVSKKASELIMSLVVPGLSVTIALS